MEDSYIEGPRGSACLTSTQIILVQSMKKVYIFRFKKALKRRFHFKNFRQPDVIETEIKDDLT